MLIYDFAHIPTTDGKQPQATENQEQNNDIPEQQTDTKNDGDNVGKLNGPMILSVQYQQQRQIIMFLRRKDLTFYELEEKIRELRTGKYRMGIDLLQLLCNMEYEGFLSIKNRETANTYKEDYFRDIVLTLSLPE